MDKLKSLIEVSDHCDKSLADLSQDVRLRLEWDLPRLRRAWDRLSADERRDAVIKGIDDLIQEVDFQSELRRNMPAESASDALARQSLDDQNRQLIFLALTALEKIRGPAFKPPDVTLQGAAGTAPSPVMERVVGEHLTSVAPIASLSSTEAIRAVVEAIKADGKQLGRHAFTEMARKLVQPQPNLDSIDALWRSLTPDDWRKSGQGSPPEGRLTANWSSYLPTR